MKGSAESPGSGAFGVADGVHLAAGSAERYSVSVTSDTAPDTAARLWKPHPDDAADVREAMACADRGEFLSPAATEAFLRWVEGASDESWRAELE